MVRYSPEIAAEICKRLAEGESLRAICRDPHMPDRATVFRWLEQSAEFRDQYASAREQGLDVMADEILDIADQTEHDTIHTIHTEQGERPDAEWIARSKLRVDTRKWLLAKLAPKKYGDRQAVEVSNPDGSLQLDDAARAARAAQLLAAAAARKSEDDGSDLT